MSFLTAGGLALALLIAIPIVAHLLRRGRVHELPFPAAALVPPHRAVARETSRLEDRALLAVRAAMIVVLAVLAATPFVRCSRLSLARHSGASVALALVIDDSMSMRARTRDGIERWPRALRGARELVRSGREGDAIAIVLAGRPARLALAPTTDLSAARKALDELVVSDRATDIEGAVQIARGALQSLQQSDKRVVLLSDLAGAPVPDGKPVVWVPVAELAHDADDCGIASALRAGRDVTVEVRCNSEHAATNRRLELVAKDGSSTSKDSVPLSAKAGSQTLSLTSSSRDVDAVHLTGTDAVESDDRAAVAADSAGAIVGIVSDPTRTTIATGGPPLLAQALDALERPIRTRPLTLVPDDPKDLVELSALILDDPPGLTPEMRAALTAWIERGGVALAMLGPRAEEAQLGSNLEPFARGRVRWDTNQTSGIDPKTTNVLGKEAESLVDLAAHARARLAGAEMPSARVTASWADGEPWMLELEQGMGLCITVGLPSSTDLSDLALRPGFLALLDRVLSAASQRNGALTSVVGTSWVFPARSQVEISGPGGKLEPSTQGRRTDESADSPEVASPPLAGRYHVRVGHEEHERIVWVDPEEITAKPAIPKAGQANVTTASARPDVDMSPETVTLVVALIAGELVLRALGRVRARRRTA